MQSSAADDGAMQFGLVWTGDAPFVRHAEALGVDSLWAGGHVTFRSPTREPLVRLAQLAVLSTTVTIGTAIAVLPLYNPAVVGKQLADIDDDSDGRVVFGIGVGGDWPPEFDACQVLLADRGPRTDEAIDVLRAMWRGTVHHDGPRYPMDGVVFEPPSRRGGPPLVVAGRKPPAMRRAALRGDGWMPYLYSPRRYAESAAAIRSLASEHGRDLAGFMWMAFAFCHVERNGDAARERAADILSHRYGRDMTPMLPRVAVAGDVEDVAEQLTAYADAGVRHLVLAPIGASPEADAELLLGTVVPQIRASRRGPVPSASGRIAADV